jgi:NitT/TauT family transport system permease protein
MSPADAVSLAPTEAHPADGGWQARLAQMFPPMPWRVLWLQLACIGIPLILWESAVRAGLADPFFFGQPSEMFAYVARTLIDGTLLFHTWVTLSEQAIGLVLGTAVGTAIALALWWSGFLSRVLETYAVILNATPKIVIAPLLIVWFGLGMTSKVMISALVTGVVAWLGAFDGVRRCDPDQADLVRALGGSERQVFVKIVVPSVLPYVFATLRLNIGFSLIGVITGEFLSSTAGLGYLVDTTSKAYEMSHTLGAILVIALIAAAELWLLARAEAYLMHWSGEVAPAPLS